MTINKKPIAAAIGALLLLGAMAVPASARWGERDDRHDEHRGWNEGYYRAPPIVYGEVYNNGYRYVPPPVVYGPSVGIYLPGVNINIR